MSLPTAFDPPKARNESGPRPARFLLQARHLACARGAKTVCAGQNLTLQAGGILWLRGRNGSGKTSLLRVLAGLASPEAGAVERAPALRTLFIGHANALKEDLSVLENLRFLAILNGLPVEIARLQAALRFWGLWSRRHAPARTLSQGLRRRVALSRLSLADEVQLWLLDEPLDALDDEGVATLYALLGQQQARGGAGLLTSHVPLQSARLQLFEHWLSQAPQA